MKICSKCHIEKSVKDFSKTARHKDGLQYWCKACILIQQRIKYHANQAFYRYTRQWQAHKYANDPEFRIRKLARRKYMYEHDGTFRAKCDNHSITRTRGLKQQFMSLSIEEQQAIIELYKNKPAGCVVDHIYPIIHGGLHCLSNLQYLTTKENQHKRIKFRLILILMEPKFYINVYINQ